MSTIQKTISPIDGEVCVERPLAEPAEVGAALERASAAKASWRRTPIAERRQLLTAMVDALVANKDAVAEELTRQMGRPIAHSPFEVNGFEERARHMIEIAEGALEDIDVGPKAGFTRFIRREPLGLVFVVAPWNYPYLTSVNAVVPALMAGNVVLLKHSKQTPLVAERYAEAAREAGIPEGVFSILHLGHDQVARVIGDDATDHVAFTGSVEGGHEIQRAIGGRFVVAGLELGGKDPGYVRADAKLDHAIETLVDGSFFNAGQSCCGIERIYVHEDVYDAFVEGAVELTKQYKLGSPLEADTTIGPVVRQSAADFIRGQIDQAVAQGARKLIDERAFDAAKPGTPYLAPQVVVDVDHSMALMTEETFGPVVGIMKVKSDDEAVTLMNDSAYGLTAAVFTQDVEAALAIGDRVETGTWFMNRCDYLDPALAWVGVKDTGRGCTLSRVGYEHLTRPKSFHLKTTL